MHFSHPFGTLLCMHDEHFALASMVVTSLRTCGPVEPFAYIGAQPQPKLQQQQV